jgi:hypothetical protein
MAPLPGTTYVLSPYRVASHLPTPKAPTATHQVRMSSTIGGLRVERHANLGGDG